MKGMKTSNESIRYWPFAIERELLRYTPEERLRVRNLKSRPIMEEFRKWLEEKL